MILARYIFICKTIYLYYTVEKKNEIIWNISLICICIDVYIYLTLFR